MNDTTDEQVERIRDFVAALRSGEYAQTHHTLARDECGKKSYCCEGVAIQRYGETLGYEVKWLSPNDDGQLLLWARDPHYLQGMFKNAPMQFWVDMGLAPDLDHDFAFELPAEYEDDNCPTRRLSYYDMNDDGFTFSQIADLIEWQHLSWRLSPS